MTHWPQRIVASVVLAVLLVGCATTPPNLPVWWTWTAPTRGAYAFDTVGSALDTVLGVYTGNGVNTLDIVGENDDAAGLNLRSRVAFEAVVGTTYQIAIGSWSSNESGAIVLNWRADVE